ncbi:hypothetical protein WFZ85_12995 [Flavobacterium sp. j3]|uniref:Uncharacterized protein n=1 Tax=Flavobacterium aureirubrum TaxID=3133147 RepID=A0ABU9N767_9FLAO
MKHELQNIISGKSQVEFGATIQAVTHYLRESKSSSEMAQGSIDFKKQEEGFLVQFANQNSLWYPKIDVKQFVSNGAEQLVYLKDSRKVLKLNDSIYYSSWEDYFNNLLINNCFFPDTAYRLLGFYKTHTTFYAVVEQNFVLATEKTNLEHVKLFLENAGFINKKNNDYYHPEWGIILEDLHDENVLTQNGILKFIDTVFYLTEQFYK